MINKTNKLYNDYHVFLKVPGLDHNTCSSNNEPDYAIVLQTTPFYENRLSEVAPVVAKIEYLSKEMGYDLKWYVNSNNYHKTHIRLVATMLPDEQDNNNPGRR